MKKKFKIIQDYYDNKEKIYSKTFVTLNDGLTVLVGCNGIGKTTLLHQIKDKCNENNIPCLSFDNLKDGGRNAREKAMFMDDINFVATSLCSSEGENINNNVGRFAEKLGRFVRSNYNSKEIFILLDALDSGLSVDFVLEVKEYLFNTIIEDCSSHDISIYLIVSANEYEMARNEQCLDTPNLAYISFKDYDEYRNYIIKTRKIKNKRYQYEDFTLS